MQWINDEILQAVCRTLFHSLWQGMIAAVLAGIVLSFTRRTAARIRYNLLGAILLLQLSAAGVTFYHEVAAPPPSPSASYTFSHSGHTLLQFINMHAASIMLVWLTVFIFRCSRLIAGCFHIRSLHRSAVPVTGEWVERLDRLSGRLGITCTVRLFQSSRIEIPFTAGLLKHCIYVPAGMLMQLPADQVEPVLLHELAHIRRKDYFVNILQNLCDAVFFFNPGMRWISMLLREERESCCDDIVIKHTPQQDNYLRALVFFQESAAGVHVGISLLRKHHLLNRLQRMLTRKNKNLNNMEKSILLSGILAVAAFGLMPASERTNALTSVQHTVYRADTTDRSSPGKTTAPAKKLPVKKSEIRVKTTKPAPAKEKKPSKYESTVPGALLKTMNISRQQEGC